MAATDFINRLFLFLTSNGIQDRYKARNSALGQHDLDIVIVFLRRDERQKFGLVIVLILLNDCQSRCIQILTHFYVKFSHIWQLSSKNREFNGFIGN